MLVLLRLPRACLLLALLLLAACSRSGAPEGAAARAGGGAEAGSDEVTPPVVRRDATNLLFSFLDPRGGIRAVSRVDEVPDAVKPRVLVVDLSKSPEERQAHRYAFFADLTAERPDGTFPVTVQSRYDAADPKAEAPSLLPPAPEGAVVVYSAVWCGFCKKAKAWLEKNGVAFVERDVERTPGAQSELVEKLRAAGVQGGGIPVIDWSGTLVMGFDQRKLEELLKKSAAAPQVPAPR